MGKKAKLYLLVIVNLIVWGYVGYKVYGAIKGDDELEFSLTQTHIKPIDKPVDPKTEILSLNYSDPFLKSGDFSGKVISRNSSVNNQNTKVHTSPVQKNENPVKSISPIALEIKYLGLVKNNTNGNLTALLVVNGKSIFVKQNELVEGYLIKSISNDVIIAIKGKEKLVISK